jgi:protease-4
MFVRRHPFLFFILAFCSVVSMSLLGITFLVVIATRVGDFGGPKAGECVGVVEIKGVIADAQETLQQLKRFREDKSVKAIVVRIDSPGGGVGPSQEIYREIRKTTHSKKVVASMGSVAASGGYYVAAAADRIVANPGTITGSIAVIMGFTNFRKVMDKIGLVPVVVKSGEYKDVGSPVREMTEEERRFLQDFIGGLHRQFVRDVVQGRDMDKNEVERLADGRIFSGEEAKELGLVDRLGNMEDAIEWAGRMGGIKGRIVTVYPPEKRLSFLKELAGSTLQGVIERSVQPEIQAQYIYRPTP